MRKPPTILYRMLAGDLLRLLGVTTVALVAVIAFAGALKPLSDGRLTLDQALKFMGYLLIPMTQFALPFAAGFAATLTYHRFASDNEAMAASAAGLGHKALLTPALILGSVLALVLGIMSFEVIPPLLRDAQRVLVTDGTRVLASQLNRGESVRITFGGSDSVDLYADRAYPPQVPEPGTDAALRGVSRVITLDGVLAIQARAEGDPVYASAERVFMFVFDDDGGETSVQLIFENASSNATESGGEGKAERITLHRLRLPTELTDDPKFLNWSQMSEAIARPRSMNRTDQAARVLAARLRERDAAIELTGAIEQTGRIVLQVDSPFETLRGETITLDGARLLHDPVIPTPDPEVEDPERARRRAQRERLDRWRVIPATEGAPIRVVSTSPDGNSRTRLAKIAWIELPIERPSDTETVTRFEVTLEDIITLDGDVALPVELTGSEPARAELTISNLMPIGFDDSTLSELPIKELLEYARDESLMPHELTPRVRAVAKEVRERVDRQRREIMSKRHERLAFSAACIVMVLVGAAVAMTLRDSLPLPVYLWSFIPALACILSISAGQRAVYRNGEIGLVLLWGGVAVLLAIFLRVYSRLRRH